MINQRNVFLRATCTTNGRVGPAPVFRTVASPRERSRSALLRLYAVAGVLDPYAEHVTAVEDLAAVLRKRTSILKGPRSHVGETFLFLKKRVRCAVYNDKTVRIEQVAKGSMLVDTNGHFWEATDLKDISDLGRIIDLLPPVR